MKKKIKFISLLIVFGVILLVSLSNINNKESNKNTKEKVVEKTENVEAKKEAKEKVENKKRSNNTKKEEVKTENEDDSAKSVSDVKKSESTKSVESTKKETKKVVEKTKNVEPKETKEKDDDNEDKKEEIKTESKKESSTVSLGTFKLTAYCGCSTCCGKWAGSPTASGAMPRANHTIAVDTSVIPFGTKVIINGNTYVAEDTGSAIKGNKIDIYFNSHSAALDFGVQYAEVFKVK